MCLGCKMRERIIARTHKRLAAIEREFERARADLHALVVDTASVNAEPEQQEPSGTQLRLAV